MALLIYLSKTVEYLMLFNYKQVETHKKFKVHVGY